MTPRQRVQAVMRGEVPDRVPLTMYECMIPQCTVERKLRNDGLCIVYRTAVFRTHTPNVRQRSETFTVDGVTRVRTFTETPVGTLTEVSQPAGFTSWALEKPFKRPEDYRALRFLVQDQRFEEDYAAFRQKEESLGEDFVLRAGIALTPLHQIMIHWMGVETFAVEWSERRDEVLSLYALMVERHREIYRLVARSPASHANYGGNEVPEVMGRERFAQYCVPLYAEAAEELHRGGVLLGSHLDGNNRAWADLVASSALDYVEAFTPPPDCDLPVGEALARWPGKFLWINFPSSVHLQSTARIEAVTADLIRQAAPGSRFLIGITEDIPQERWQGNMLAIARAIGRVRPSGELHSSEEE
ncbi:MAG: hypothetical protein AB1505_00400 [Candidatus Latescibacterota bacterium]